MSGSPSSVPIPSIREVLDRRYDVCMITTRHPLRDPRVYYKEAVTLADRLGLKVLVLAIADRETVDDHGSLVVCGIRGAQRDVLRSVLRVARVLRRVDARVFHVHDFEALVLLPYLKYLKGRPVIYDVHEHYDLMIRNVVALPDVVRGPLEQVVNLYEWLFSRMSDHVILVEEGQRARFAGFRVPEARTSVIRNLVSLRGFEPSECAKSFDLVYSGSCWAGRAVYELLDAVELAKARGQALRLLMLLIGKQDEIDRLQAHIAAHGLGAQVEVRARVPYEEVARALATARIGVMLVHDSASHRAGIPTKVMEYGAAGLPVLVNQVNTFSVEYVGRHGAGAVIASLAPEAILDGIARIDADYAGSSMRAREAARSSSWEADEGKLLDVYQRLLDQSPT